MKPKLLGVIVIVGLALSMLVTAAGAIQDSATPSPAEQPATVTNLEAFTAPEGKPLWQVVCPFH